MNALYKNRIYNIVDDVMVVTLDGAGVQPFDVYYDDPDLVIDPTDDEVADAINLAEWYGVDTEAAAQLRLMLLGAISIDHWEEWKASRRTRR
jgi:hypothetical protein